VNFVPLGQTGQITPLGQTGQITPLGQTGQITPLGQMVPHSIPEVSPSCTAVG